MHSPLLIDEHPLQVLPSLAVAIGLQDAIVLQQIHYWLGKSKNIHEGRPWVYNTYEQWTEQFPFWSAEAIRKIVKSLRDRGLIHARRMSPNAWDKTNSYTINYEVLREVRATRPDAEDFTASTGKSSVPSGKNGRIKAAKSTASKRSKIPHLYTETTTETTAETTFPPTAFASVAPTAFSPLDDAVADAQVKGEAKEASDPQDDPADPETGTALEVIPPAKQATRKRAVATVGADAETALQAACRATWDAYKTAYINHYGVAPLRNAKVNSAIKGFVQRAGYDESPAIAAFYVNNVNDSFVIKKMHDTGLLLNGTEAYRAQWATGCAVTTTAARQADQTAANFSVVEEAKQIARARRAAREAAAAAGEYFL